MECVVNHVSLKDSTITLQKYKQAGIFKVEPASGLSINNSKAELKDFTVGMHVTLTVGDAGTVARMNGHTTPSGSGSAASSDEPITQRKEATIAANSADGFLIPNVRKDAQIYLQYSKGSWKNHGHVAQFSPDDAKTPASSKLAIVAPKTDRAPANVLVVVPANTAKQPFKFVVDKDYPALALRINSGTSSNPGKVEYKVTIVPAPR